MISQPHSNYSSVTSLRWAQIKYCELKIKSALPGVLSSLTKQAKESTLGQLFTFCKIWEALKPGYN